MLSDLVSSAVTDMPSLLSGNSISVLVFIVSFPTVPRLVDVRLIKVGESSLLYLVLLYYLYCDLNLFLILSYAIYIVWLCN